MSVDDINWTLIECEGQGYLFWSLGKQVGIANLSNILLVSSFDENCVASEFNLEM